MGMHTRANENVKSYGFSPASAIQTRARGTSSARKINEAVKALAEGLSLEGLVRIWAVLEASKVASPGYALGDAGMALARGLAIEISKKRKEASTASNAALVKQLEGLSTRVETLADEIRAAIDKAGEGE